MKRPRLIALKAPLINGRRIAVATIALDIIDLPRFFNQLDLGDFEGSTQLATARQAAATAAANQVTTEQATVDAIRTADGIAAPTVEPPP